jgi:hypothetical protein
MGLLLRRCLLHSSQWLQPSHIWRRLPSRSIVTTSSAASWTERNVDRSRRAPLKRGAPRRDPQTSPAAPAQLQQYSHQYMATCHPGLEEVCRQRHVHIPLIQQSLPVLHASFEEHQVSGTISTLSPSMAFKSCTRSSINSASTQIHTDSSMAFQCWTVSSVSSPLLLYPSGGCKGATAGAHPGERGQCDWPWAGSLWVSDYRV